MGKYEGWKITVYKIQYHGEYRSMEILYRRGRREVALHCICWLAGASFSSLFSILCLEHTFIYSMGSNQINKSKSKSIHNNTPF